MVSPSKARGERDSFRRVEVDARGRVALGPSVAGQTFRMTVRRDGAILLEPARVLTQAEIANLGESSLSEELAAHGDPGS